MALITLDIGDSPELCALSKELLAAEAQRVDAEIAAMRADAVSREAATARCRREQELREVEHAVWMQRIALEMQVFEAQLAKAQKELAAL